MSNSKYVAAVCLITVTAGLAYRAIGNNQPSNQVQHNSTSQSTQVAQSYSDNTDRIYLLDNEKRVESYWGTEVKLLCIDGSKYVLARGAGTLHMQPLYVNDASGIRVGECK